MRRSVCTAAVIVSLVAPVAASPQEATGAPPPDPSQSSSTPVFHTEVVVTPERQPEARHRIPAATAVLTRAEMERRPAETLPELLELLPGVHVLFDQVPGGAAMVSSRGFFGGGEADYVQLLVDGVPVVDVESGLADWAALQAGEIERIESLRGPGSSLYGDTALGGVIQVFSRRQAASHGRAWVTSGSTGLLLAGGGYHGSIGPVALGLSGSGSRTSGYRQNSAARQGVWHASVTWPAIDPRWTLEFDGLSRRRHEPGPLTGSELAADPFASNEMFRFDREDTRRGRAAITYRRMAGAVPAQLRVHLASRGTDRLRTLLIAAGLGDRSLRGVSTLAATVSGEAGTTLGAIAATELQINSGVEISQERLDTDYRAVSDSGEIGARTASLDARRRRAAAFGSVGWAVNPRVRLSSGVRVDHIADRVAETDVGPRHSAWSPRVGLNVLVGGIDRRPLSLFVQSARAFKAPTIDQLFDPHPFPDFRGGTFQISSDTLEPQRAWNVEAGMSQSIAGIRWEVVAYRMTVRNEIDFDPATFRYNNIGRSRHTGVEVDVRVASGRPVSASLAYTLTRAVPLGEAVRPLQLKNIPEHLVRSELTIAPRGAPGIHVRHTLTAGRHLDDEHRFPLRDASTVDVRVEQKLGRSRLTLDALNVTDTRVEELGFALPGPSGTPVPYYYAGIGITVRAGFAIDF